MELPYGSTLHPFHDLWPHMSRGKLLKSSLSPLVSRAKLFDLSRLNTTTLCLAKHSKLIILTTGEQAKGKGWSRGLAYPRRLAPVCFSLLHSIDGSFIELCRFFGKNQIICIYYSVTWMEIDYIKEDISPGMPDRIQENYRHIGHPPFQEKLRYFFCYNTIVFVIIRQNSIRVWGTSALERFLLVFVLSESGF